MGFDFIESLSLFNIKLSFVCNVVSRSSAQCATADQTGKFLKPFSPVFTSNLGRFTQAEATLALKPSTKPVFQPKRLIPYVALPLVNKELKRLEEMKMINLVIYSQWAAPIVVVKIDNGSIRLFADVSTCLNAAQEDHQYPLPIPEDIFTILNGFAQLKLTEAHLQVVVSAASRELLKIDTHHCLFQYTRFTFGVKTSPTIFQQIMDTMLAGVESAAAYLDGIIVVDQSKQELTERIDKVLTHIQDFGFQLRLESEIFTNMLLNTWDYFSTIKFVVQIRLMWLLFNACHHHQI